nr:uncharacterized protein LOC112030465 [Quercus suber]
MSPSVGHGKTFREKSLPVFSAKGTQSLAKRIKLGTAIVKTGALEWTDSDQHGSGEIASKRMETSIDFGGCRQKSVTSHQDIRNLHIKQGGSLVPEGKENNEFLNLSKEMMHSTCADSRSALFSSKEINRTLQVIENNPVGELEDRLDASLTGQQLEASNMERETSDMFDIGFKTQVAAEVMEALAYGLPAGDSHDNAYQSPENTLDHFTRGVNENEAHFGHSSFQETACFDLGDIARKTKRRKRSARRFSRGSSGSFQKQFVNQELDLELAITTKVRRGKSSDQRQLNSGNSGDAIEIENVSLGKVESQGKCMNLSLIAHQNRQWMSGGNVIKTKNQLDNPGDVIVQYRRKKSRVVADPVEVLRANEGNSKLDFNSSREARNSKLNHKDQFVQRKAEAS